MEKIKNLEKGSCFKLRPDLETRRCVADHDLSVIWELGEDELGNGSYAAYDIHEPNRMTFVPADVAVIPVKDPRRAPLCRSLR